MPYDPVVFPVSSAPLMESWKSIKTVKKTLDSVDTMTGDQPLPDKRLAGACQQLESMFMAMLLQEMRKGIPHDGLIPESNATNLYTTLFDNHLADLLAERQATGLGQFFYHQLLDSQPKNT
ncbi:MAG: rod-binding protein [Deltaproteobacteria bacterium]|nr:rod-binding protein [Candidatus Anaeroferrophillus wilburensis]MBN2889607.1 rod-binding protein [Deltaproteobacteria bacterium]